MHYIAVGLKALRAFNFATNQYLPQLSLDKYCSKKLFAKLFFEIVTF